MLWPSLSGFFVEKAIVFYVIKGVSTTEKVTKWKGRFLTTCMITPTVACSIKNVTLMIENKTGVFREIRVGKAIDICLFQNTDTLQ